jgi:hypothetical protein
MQTKNEETNNLLTEDKDTKSARKIWETPKLRILPVPAKTQGGKGNKNDQDDIFYDMS